MKLFGFPVVEADTMPTHEIAIGQPFRHRCEQEITPRGDLVLRVVTEYRIDSRVTGLSDTEEGEPNG